MQEKQVLMIRKLLQSAKPISGKQLASFLGVSTRTIINYINNLNSAYSEPVVVSTSNGYVIDQSKASAMLNQVNEIPDGYGERSFYICKLLLLGERRKLDAFELSDEMCISYSLLKNDLQKMNQSYAYLNIRFAIKNNQVMIVGREKDKRKLMNHMLTQSQEASLLDLATLKRYFPEHTVENSLFILESIVRENNYYLNDFTKANIMLHILTMVTRILSGNNIQADLEKNIELDVDKDEEYLLISNQLCQELEQCFHIGVCSTDRIQLYFLIKSSLNLMEADTEEALSRYIESELMEQIKSIIENTEEKFFIHLNNDDFFLRFALHINSMRLRCINQMQLVNPLKATLRSSSPFLYDIAIYIAQQLREKKIILDYLSEDELSFIVLHIGAEIERQNVSENKINCVLIIPEYLNLRQSIIQKLLLRFDDQITIRQTLSLKDTATLSDCDLVISVINKQSASEGRHVYISPFLSTADYTAIGTAIDMVQMQKSLEYLRKNFDFYFAEENFRISTASGLDYKAAIDQLCDILIRNGYVTDEYRENVFKREEAASTAYFDFAIPHSVSLEASINTIGVLISPDGIRWGDHLVYVVFLMAISPDSLNDFQTLYGMLAQILTNAGTIKSLQNCTSFQAFKSHMLNPELY